VPIDEGINTDLRFLLLEVRKQAKASLAAIERPTAKKLEKIRIREDYIDNLKNTIENKSYFNIHQQEEGQMNGFRAVITIASNLERCADFFKAIAEQMEYVKDPENFQQFELRRYYRVIYRAIDAIYPALTEHNLDLAQKICDYEETLDEYYKESHQKIKANLQQRRKVGDMLALLDIVRYLERAGDSFLNIGEAIFDIHVGEKMGIVQFKNLRRGLESLNVDISTDAIEFTPIMNTRSGCRVAKISIPNRADQRPVFYKEGLTEKVKADIVGLKFWQQKFPGKTPKILWDNTRKDHTILLMEYIDGDDLMAIMLKPRADLDRALQMLGSNASRIWLKAKRDRGQKPDFVNQLSRRKDDVESVHSALFDLDHLDEMLDRARNIESKLRVPFTTLIHGDFNADNILIQLEQKKVYYVDVHRSKYGDYVQDVSVFLVSNIRLPIFSSDVRARLNSANRAMYACGASFAARQKDPWFDARLALGLFRSLITSTRFIFDKSFSSALYDRAELILNTLEQHDTDFKKFKLTEELFLYE
jgi:phosphate uptake regulator